MTRFLQVLVALVLGAILWAVGSQGVFDNRATITGRAPTTQVDGAGVVTPLTDLASIRIYRSVGPTGQRALVTTLPFTDEGGEWSHVDQSLANGNWCYVATAVRANGNESAVSNQGCKTIDTLLPSTMTISVN